MRKYLPLLTAALAMGFCSCASQPNARTNYVPPSTSLVRQSVTSASERAVRVTASLAAAAAKAKTATERIKVIEKAVAAQPPILTLAQQLHGDLDELTKLLLDTNKENDALKEDLGRAQTQITELQDEVNQQTSQLNTANAERNAAITQGAIDKRNAHKFKWIIIGLAVGATGLIVFAIFGIASFAPPLLWLLGGAPLAVGTFLYFYLGSSG